MKGTGAAIKVGITAILVVALAYVAFKSVSKGLKHEAGYPAWATFRDATGLVDKSRVQIAGLIVGEIRERSLFYDPTTNVTQAKVSLRIRDDVVLWSNAAVYKRSASLLGEFYLEIDPGTPESPDAQTGKPRANYPIKGCFERTHVEGCDRIKNVIEAITTTDVLVQVNETLPVLRDILRDVHTLTQGPLQDIAREVKEGVKTNSDAAERLLDHVDQIALDMRNVTNPNGQMVDDLRESLHNVRDITNGIKGIVGEGGGQLTNAGDRIRHDLDKIGDTLDKIDHTIDQVNGVVEHVAAGQGTVGKLLTDDTIAKNVQDITEDTANFTRSIFRLQTLVDIHEEFNIQARTWKTYLSLRLQPRPDKYYLIELVDDPRGSYSYNHTLQSTSVVGSGQAPSMVNVDTWTRTPAFRLSFMFAKRIEGRGVGLTGLVGIKESTGGLAAIVDFWHQRAQLKIDLFDFATEQYPRLKVLAAVEVLKHFWLLGGVDDIINGRTDTAMPSAATCPSSGNPMSGTPSSWCQGGRDYFVGAALSFNDEDLRALLTIGGAALAGAATSNTK